MSHKMLLIDTQVLVGPYRQEMYTPQQLRDLQARHSKYFDMRFLAVPSHPNLNSGMPALVERNRDVYAGAYLQVVPQDVNMQNGNLVAKATTPTSIEGLALDKRIVGLKYVPSLVRVPLDDERFLRYANIAATNEIPFLIHAESGEKNEFTSHAQKEKLHEEFPSLKIIWAHMTGLDESKVVEGLELVSRLSGAYTNTTGASGEQRRTSKTDFTSDTNVVLDNNLRSIMEYLIFQAMKNKELHRKVLFGSDYPYLKNYPASLAAAKHLSESERELLFHRNAIELFGLHDLEVSSRKNTAGHR